MINWIAKLQVPAPIRIFLGASSFFVALDASIALNRWWLEGGFEVYLGNLILMLGGFIVFVIFFSNSGLELIGYVFLCAAVYFIGNYEIGGPSRLYLTPLDPVFGLGPAFTGGPASVAYRKSVAFATSLLAAFVLAFSKLKLKVNKKQQ